METDRQGNAYFLTMVRGPPDSYIVRRSQQPRQATLALAERQLTEVITVQLKQI